MARNPKRGGVTLKDISAKSALGWFREVVDRPDVHCRVADTNTIAKNVDLTVDRSSGFTEATLNGDGPANNYLAPAAMGLRLVFTDASGDATAFEVRLTGERFGRKVQEVIAIDTSSALTYESTLVFDRVTKVELNNAAEDSGDLMDIYPSLDKTGLKHPITNQSDVKSVCYVDLTNEHITYLDLDSDNVSVSNGAIQNLKTDTGAADAATEDCQLIVIYQPNDHHPAGPLRTPDTI